MRDLRTRGLALIVPLLLIPVASAHAQRVRLDSTARHTWAALLAAHDTRTADTTVIDRALGSSVAPLRAAAARVVGTNRIAARYAALRARLRTERDSAAVSDAAFALGLAGDVGSCEALRSALAAPAIGAAAAWALGELGNACGDFAPLLASAATASAREGLLRVAGKWTPFPDTSVVRAYERARLPGQRWAALYALSRARRPEGAALAVAARRSSDPRLREVAARLLTATLQPPADSQRIVAMLDTMLADAAPHVRIAAVRSLGTYGARAESSMSRAYSRERDTNVRLTMAQAIATVGSDTSALWASWWGADSTRVVRRALLASARQARALTALESAAIALSDTSDVDRAATARSDSTAAVPTDSARSGPSTDYDRIVREIIEPSLAGRGPSLRIETDRGPVRIALDGVQAPMTSDHLLRLARAGYYRNLRFHRVVPAFVAQGGDPRGTGNGGPGYAIRDELNRSAYVRGAVGMALSGPDTGGSQFFLTLAPQPHLDGHYTVFGRVATGATAMDALVQGDAMRNITPLPQ